MFIRHVHYNVKPECFDEAVALFKDTVFTQLEREPGFMRAILTGDAAAGEGVVYTMWQSEADAERYVRSGDAARLLGPFTDLLESPPRVEGYPSIFDREF